MGKKACVLPKGWYVCHYGEKVHKKKKKEIWGGCAIRGGGARKGKKALWIIDLASWTITESKASMVVETAALREEERQI